MNTLLPYGATAVLIEAADSTAALGLHEAVAAAGLTGLVESVPAARTVLVTFHDAVSRAAAEVRLRALSPVAAGASEHRLVEVPTRYDGPDLAEVERLAGMSRDAVVERHSATVYTVSFVGFAPGFAYLGGVDPQLMVPRRSSPRTAVAPGSVALAGEYTAVYPRSSPGGWQLIGSTAVRMWDLTREEPALLRAGDRVRFVPERA